jgi:branched-chain amino acid transport system substrate-binding protein
VKGAKPYTGFEGTAFDAANLAFLAAVRACSASPAAIKARLRDVSGPPGVKVTYRQMNRAVQLALAGKGINYEGAWGPIDWDANGDPGSAVYEIWRYQGKGVIKTQKLITFRS